MNLLSIGSDRKVFQQGSAVHSRLLEYGRCVGELHVVVFAKKSLGFKDESLHPNIFLYPTNSYTKAGYFWSAVKKGMMLKHKDITIDVVTVQDPFEAGFVGMVLSRAVGAGLHVQIHTDFMSPYFSKESLLNRLRVYLAKYTLRNADAVRVVSERIKKSIESLVRPGIPVVVVPIFSEKKDTGFSARNLKKDYPQFEKHILMASRLTPEKNIIIALEAMKEITTKHSKIGLVIVGSGPEEKRLKDFVQKNNLTQNVVFEGWSENLGPYYKTADVFLLTSNYEGYAMTVVEALSFCCPVIMTDVGCAGEVVKDRENGLVVPVGDSGALTRALVHVVTGGQRFKIEPLEVSDKESRVKMICESWAAARK